MLSIVKLKYNRKIIFNYNVIINNNKTINKIIWVANV